MPDLFDQWLFPGRWKLTPNGRGPSVVISAGDVDRLEAAIDQACGDRARVCHVTGEVRVGQDVVATLTYLGPAPRGFR